MPSSSKKGVDAAASAEPESSDAKDAPVPIPVVEQTSEPVTVEVEPPQETAQEAVAAEEIPQEDEPWPERFT